MDDLSRDEEKAAALWNAQADQYNQWSELGADEKAEWIAKCAAPVVADDGLPPLPDPIMGLWSENMKKAWANGMRDYARSAVAADRAARANSPEIPDGCAQQQAQSVDTPEFQALVGKWERSDEGEAKQAWGALIAYIDGRAAGAALEVTTPTCRNCLGFGWEPSVSGERRPCAFCQDAAPSPQQGKEGV